MESFGSDDIGLVIPLLVAINPLDVDVHVDVVVALPLPDCVPFPVADEPFPFRTWVNADVMADEADELDGGGRVSDGRLDDELIFDGNVGDELFRIGGTEFNEFEFIVMFIPVSCSFDIASSSSSISSISSSGVRDRRSSIDDV